MKRIVSVLTALVIYSLMIITYANATSFLEEEAGICAYTNAGRTINMARVKPLYRTIEHETDNYVIGSIPIADYPETEDVHVYISEDGWVAAYYPATDPVSKIIDWRNYQGAEITGTKLELALSEVSNTVNFPLVDVKYYDFVCPQATNLMMVIDNLTENGEDSFDIMIPNDIIVYERSWGHYVRYANSNFHIDDNQISHLVSWEWAIGHGKLTPDQLKQDLFHKVRLDGSSVKFCAGGIVLVYQKL